MKSGFFAASLLITTLFFGAYLPVTSTATAADGDAAALEEVSSNRFIRIGLNKSAVVRLPAEARDVIVGNPAIVDAVVRTKNTAYLFARSAGQTNIFFFDANGQQILALDLEVATDTTGLRKLLNRTIPNNRITVDMVGTNVVLGGTARNALESKTAVDLANKFSGATGDTNTVINTMMVEGEDQVMLKVKVVEIQREVLKQFGVDFAAMLDVGKLAFNIVNAPTGFTNGILNSASGAKTGMSSGGSNVEGLIRAMESDGLIRTLAEPNLTALTGQSAKFVAGGETATYVACGTENNFRCSEFKEYGVQVNFTPTVLSDDRIVLKIQTNVSEPLDGGDFTKRSIDTTLELPSGGTMMVAGLIKESSRQALDGTPGLKKLPVLGQLFRSQDFRANETELVVFVTPILVRPTTQGKLTSPDKGFVPPSDKQAIFMGRLNKVYGGTADAPGGTYHGNVGFIVE